MKSTGITFISLLTLLLSACSQGPASMDELSERYVKLVLALGEHDSGYVDAYYGPDSWVTDAKKMKLSAQQIAGQAKQLHQQLAALVDNDDEMEKLRGHYLDRQLVALQAHANAIASGKRAAFDSQSQSLYDTVAPTHAFEHFAQPLAELEALLPGDAPLNQRVETFLMQFYIPREKQDAVFARAIEECRSRTKAHIQLPMHENFTLEYVQDKPWSGYNWYQGNAQSLIQLNVELPIEISRAVDLGCHEGYPGHHTYNALLENNLVNEKGWLEFSVYPLYSPQSLIAEGSANYGIELAFPGEQKEQFERDVLFPLAGIDPQLAEQYAEFNRLKAELSYASNEVARQYLAGTLPAEKAIELLQTYSLYSPEKAAQRIRFFDTYGAYVINYNWGKDLVKDYVEQAKSEDERWQRFARLLASPRVPSSIFWN